MRRWLLLLATTGCFSEGNDPPSECSPGEPGCDCASDGTCVEGSECVAAIDKCVPKDCSPGSRTCTCAEGNECLGMLTCQEGVCLDPPPETTGDPTNASSAQTTDATNTGPMTSSPGTDTVTDTMPSDTGTATEPVDTGADMTATSDPSTTMNPAVDVGQPVDCVQCLIGASMQDDCSTATSNCIADTDMGGCYDLYTCATNGGGSVQECCDMHNATPMGHLYWSLFADCAQDQDCMMQCFLMCPV